jgi:hypothetical protein
MVSSKISERESFLATKNDTDLRILHDKTKTELEEIKKSYSVEVLNWKNQFENKR